MKLSASGEQVVSHQHFMRRRHVPDVPQDVDSVMDHLNDPNYDLPRPSPASETLNIGKEGDLSQKFSMTSLSMDTESQADSVHCATTSGMPDLDNFDEYGILLKH